MKFILSVFVYLIIGVVLGIGILLTVKGSPWFLILGFVGYLLAFSKFGCLPPH